MILLLFTFFSVGTYGQTNFFKNKVVVYKLETVINGKLSQLTLRLYPISETAINFDLIINDHSGSGRGINTSLKYDLTQTAYSIQVAEDKTRTIPAFRLYNYDGFEVIISSDDFKYAKIKLPDASVGVKSSMTFEKE